MRKILFVATVVKTHIMEFHIPYLKMLKEDGWETAVAAHNDYVDPSECSIPWCDHFYDIPFERNPIKSNNIKAYHMLKDVIDSGKYDVIHCHTPVGAALTRLAASHARKRGAKVIYTAHGFHFYKGAPVLNWLFFYPVERMLANKTDILITINREDYKRAKKFNAGRVEYIPGVGVDVGKFGNITNSNEIKKQLNIQPEEKVILSVGEINKNKNHKVVIEALPALSDCCFVICGQGPLEQSYKEQAAKLGVSNRLILAGYRNNIADFYNMADVFAFPSFREGLPVALIEAMASGLPVVCTNIRGSSDIVEDGVNGYFIEPTDPESVVVGIKKALKQKDEFSERNKRKAEQYELGAIIKQYKALYDA